MSAVLTPRPVDADRFAVAHVSSKTSPVVGADALAWPHVVDMLLLHRVGPKDGPGFMPAAIDPGPRNGERVAHVSLLALDVEAHAEALPDGTKRVTGPLPPPLRELAAELQLGRHTGAPMRPSIAATARRSGSSFAMPQRQSRNPPHASSCSM